LVFTPGDERFGMPIWALVLPYLAIGVFRAWIFNNTNGSVLAAALFHAAGNTAGEIVPPLSAPFRFFWDLILYVVAFVIVLLFGPRTLTRGKRVRSKPATQG
jgi:membrane protease YdiL (CAAX protease family)